ncbi:phage tail spike protein [Streptococcus himalayensis]|uniref:Tail spike domain-containing protein n=1 Tax=Streptococcus himalayensis TaxID=1888195 RepID=A0A917EFA6_9STRE|nr:phage tail spike protein [Streptococcus himalayensis]QBX16524.1 tail fibers protein [Streptococcus phage Javan255]GGE26842.1 hypothetical protein GCM10011510_05040 [Streptococcus himalayensis]
MLSLLDKTVKTAKWHGKALPETIKASVKEILNGDFVLTFTYPITDSGLYRELKEDYLVRSPVPVLGHQLFRIKKVIEGDCSIEVTAYHISEDIMTRLLAPFRCEQVPCATALTSLVMASKTPLGDFSFTSDIVKPRTYTADKEQTLYSTLLDGNHSIVGTWEGELVRDNLALSIQSNRGENRGVILSTHFNLKTYQRTTESSQMITRIHATSSFKQEGQDEETVLTVTVDSPLITQYPFINEVTYTNNNLKTRQELEEWARAKFRLERIDRPKDTLTIEAYELDGQTVHLGDTVTLKSRLHGIDMTKKAVAYDYDPLAESYRSITFDDKATVGTSSTSGGLSTLAHSLVEGNKRSEDVAIEAAIEHANRAFEAAFEKGKAAIDDAIEQAQSHGEVYADRLKASLDSELSAVNQRMHQQEEEQNRTTRDLLAQAGVNTHLATEAKQKAEEAETGAREALRRAEQAKVEAVQEANRFTTSERSQTETKIATAKAQAILEASRLVDVAKALLSGQLTTVSTSLTQTKEEMKLLSSKQVVDSLTGRVTSTETTITQLGDRITTDIRQVEGKIPVSLDTVNLVKGTDQAFVMGYGITNTSWDSSEKKAVLSLTQTGVEKARYDEILPQNHQFFSFIPQNGTTYTQSMLVDTDASFLGRNGLEWSWYTSRGHQTTPAFIRQIGTNTYQIWSTHTWTLTNERLRAFDVFHLHRVLGFRTSGTYLKFYKPKLTLGPLPSDWSPSPEDVTDEFRSVKTSIQQTASGVEQVSTRLTEEAGKLSTAETQIRQLVNDVSSKVSQTDFNTVKQTVESHTTSLHQTNQSIALKADKAFVDGVKSSADVALSKASNNATLIAQTKAELRVAQDAITQKVAKTDFNTLLGRVSNAETSIRTQAGQIEEKLSNVQLEQILGQKGYQNLSQVETLITTTAGEITTRLSQVEGKIPTQIGGVNLMRNTDKAFVMGYGITNTTWEEATKKATLRFSSGVRRDIHQEVLPQSGRFFDFVPTKGTTYTQSIFVETDATFISEGNFSCTWFTAPDRHNEQPAKIKKMGDKLYRIWSTYTWNLENNRLRAFDFFDLHNVLAFRTSGTYLSFFHPQLEVGTIPTDWHISPQEFVRETVFHEVRDTVSNHTRAIGDHTNQISQVIQTANGIVTRVGSLETSRATTTTVNAIQTQVSTLAGSWSVRNLTSAGTVLSQLNLNKDGSVKIDGKLVQITGTTYIQDGVIASGKIASLDAGKITSGLIAAARIGSEAITSDKLKVDQAFFNKFMANDAYLRQLFAKSAFITQVQAVTLSANNISGGILTALNGAMKIHLTQGNIKFFTNSPSISREVSGYPHQWVSFETGTSNGKPCGVTIIGSNRWNNWNANDGGFVGIRAWNGANDDQIDIVGDSVRLASSPYTNPDGWNIVTLPNRLSIDAHRAVDRPTSVLNIGDIRIYRNASTYVSLKDVLQQFNHNFKHLVNITGRGDVLLTWDTIK